MVEKINQIRQYPLSILDYLYLETKAQSCQLSNMKGPLLIM